MYVCKDAEYIDTYTTEDGVTYKYWECSVGSHAFHTRTEETVIVEG